MIDPAKARVRKAEIQRDRILSRKSLVRLVEATSVIQCEPWQRKLYERLEKLPFQKGQRLAVKAPPQTGKTTGGAQRLPALYWGHNPTARVRLLTYNETHSKEHGAVIQQVMKSDYYRHAFSDPGCQMPEDGPKQIWSTTARSQLGDGQASFAALGLQTGVVGGGAELYIFDDPYHSRDDAFSDTTNENMRNMWKENVLPRLSPDDNVLSLCHAWNERDFNAFLLEECGFEEIRIASICDSENDFAGRTFIPKALSVTYEEYLTLSDEEKLYLEQTALTPRQPLAHLLKIRDGYRREDGRFETGMGNAAFESLHQGNAKARGGSRFHPEDFKYVESFRRDEEDMYFSYWDLGGSDAESSDNTANWVLHKSPGGLLTFVEHVVFKLRESDRNDRIHAIEREYFKKYRNVGLYMPFVEWQFGIGTDITTPIVRKCAAFGMQTDRVRRPLKERVIPLAIAMQAHNVRYLKADWNVEAEREFLDFRDGESERRNDRVSAAAGAFNVAMEYNIA